MRRRSIYSCLGLLLAAVLVVSCSGIGQSNNSNKTTNPTTTTVPGLSFDISKAKAIAGNSSAAKSLSSKALGNKARSSSLAALVKIMDDGTLASAIKFSSNSGWTPDIAFISVGDDKSVYICFSNMYTTWNSDNTQSNVQFVRVHPDNTYNVIWPPDPANYNYNTTGQVNTWTWVGMDTDPLQRGADGKVYFKVSTYAGSSNNDSIYTYDPTAGGAATLRTPANGTLSIESFMVDSAKHLFIKSTAYGGSGTASYLRCYSSGVTAPLNIYYTSTSSDMWVRGYETTPTGNALILNGQNINGLSGIMRANITSPSTVTYDLLYPSGINYTYISLVQWGTSTNAQAIVDYDYTNYTWDPSVLTNGVLDQTKLLAKVAGYYFGSVSISPSNFATLAGLTSTQMGDYSLVWPWANTAGTGNTFGSAFGNSVSNYAQQFLRYYFTGTLMQDYLAAQNLQNIDLSNVGSMIWNGDGSLYGLYDSSWWSGTGPTGTKVLKLLDSSGNIALASVDLAHGTQKPSKIKFDNGYLYYRYSIMNGSAETGYHKLARLNIGTKVEEELMSTDPYLASTNLEVESYDVSSDGATVYFSALDYSTNNTIFGKIDMATKAYTAIPADATYNTVKTF